MATDYDITAYPIPPGKTLEEELAFRGIYMPEAAHALGISTDHLLDLLAGDAALTNELAVSIEAYLDIPAYLWTGLEEDYQAALAKKARLDAERQGHEEVNPTIPIPPGELLEEDLTFRGIGMPEAAQALGISAEHLSNLIEGAAVLTAELAERIEAYLGSPAHLWLGLEEDYRTALTKKAQFDAGRWVPARTN